MKSFSSAGKPESAKAGAGRTLAVAAAVLGYFQACEGTGPAKVASDCDENPSLPGCSQSDSRCSNLPKDAECLDRTFFRQEVLPILTRNCITCHVDSGLAWGSTQLSLVGEAAWDSLVNIPSVELSAFGSTMMRIKPGMPESSYLYLKLTRDNPPVGSRMPMSAAPLASAEIGKVRQWIRGRPWE